MGIHCNHIQNFHLERYIVGYTFGNHVLRLPLRVAVKLNFRPYIRRYTSPNENFEYHYPLSDLLILIYGVKLLPEATLCSKQLDNMFTDSRDERAASTEQKALLTYWRGVKPAQIGMSMRAH